MILADTHLHEMFHDLIQGPHANKTLINPASIDICIGDSYLIEDPAHNRGFIKHSMPVNGVQFAPGTFLLIPTLEILNVPNGFAMELRLKSSSARAGWNHSLAFWFDPGWNGVGTMEVQNITVRQYLTLKQGQRFAQIIVHKLSCAAAQPYVGKYNGATTVEAAKP